MLKTDLNKTIFAYIKGVLDGDGSIDWFSTNPRIQLHVTNKLFALEFFYALRKIGLTPYLNEWSHKQSFSSDSHPRFRNYKFTTQYYIARATCKPKLIKYLNNLKILTKKEKIAYVRGFYQSEGSYSIVSYPNRTCYHLKITNSNLTLLRKIKNFVKDIMKVGMTLRKYSYMTSYIALQKKGEIQNFLKTVGVEG